MGRVPGSNSSTLLKSITKLSATMLLLAYVGSVDFRHGWVFHLSTQPFRPAQTPHLRVELVRGCEVRDTLTNWVLAAAELLPAGYVHVQIDVHTHLARDVVAQLPREAGLQLHASRYDVLA